MTEPVQNNYLCGAPIRMTGGEFALKMFRFWGLIPVIFMSVFFLSGIAVGFLLDIRYLIVSAMAIFILLPTAMMFLYYYHGLDKNCYFNIVDHNILLKDDCIEITMYFHLVDDMGNDKDIADDNCSDSNCEISRSVRKSILSINYKDIGKYKVFSDCVIYPIGRPVTGFIWLPVSAFDDAVSFREAIGLLSSHLK